MERIALISLFEKPISGEWGRESDEEGNNSVGVIRTTNFSKDIRMKVDSEIVKRLIDDRKVDKKKLIVGDIIIEKSGGSPTQPVGRILYYDLTSGVNLCNNFTSVLRPKKGNDNKFLACLMNSLYKKGEVLK